MLHQSALQVGWGMYSSNYLDVALVFIQIILPANSFPTLFDLGRKVETEMETRM